MSIKDGWFSETEVLWPGQKFSLEVRHGIRGRVVYGAHRDHDATLPKVPRSHVFETCRHTDPEIPILSTTTSLQFSSAPLSK